MKSRSSLIKEQPRNTGVRINKPYMGSFCQSQEGIMKESNSNDISSINKNFKTPIRQSKISINLTKTEKNAIREPYVTAITLDVLPKESRVSKVDKSNISINNSQLLSSKMTSDPISITKPSPFQSTRKFDNSRVKTSLEIYSKNTKTIKNDKTNMSHQRNWSDIYTDEKPANVSAAASSRSDVKQPLAKEDRKKNSQNSLIIKKHYSEAKNQPYVMDPEIQQNLQLTKKITLGSSDHQSYILPDDSITSLNNSSSVMNSPLDMGNEHEPENLMYSLPLEECFNLVHFESKKDIDSLAQAVPSLNTKSKQIPKVSSMQDTCQRNEKSNTSEKDNLSYKMSTYSSFKKKHSNQVTRSKLSNYINMKQPETIKKIKHEISPKIMTELKHCGSSDSKAFESSSILSKADSLKSLMSSKRSPKSSLKSNMSVSKTNIDKLKTLSNSNKITSLIGSIQKIRLDEPQLSSRCKKVKRVGKQNTVSSESSNPKMGTIYNSNTSQDLEYHKTSARVLTKNKSNQSQKFEKFNPSEKQLKKDSSNYSRASNTSKKYYHTMNSNSERGHKVSTKRLRQDIEEIKAKHQKNKLKETTISSAQTGTNFSKTNKKKNAYNEVPARIKAKLILSPDKPNTKMIGHIAKLNSSRSIGETESESTKAQTSHTSAYFKRAKKGNRRLEDITHKYSDVKRAKNASKVDSLMQSYQHLKISKNDKSKEF